MSRLYRKLMYSISELENSLTLKQRIIDYYDNFIEWITPDWYYELRAYINNFRLFNSLARDWRPWDSIFTINVFVKLLIEQAHCCKNSNHKNEIKRYRQALTAAHLLNRAYEYNCTKDRAYMYLVKKYPTKWETRTIQFHEGASQKTKQLIDFASKRIDRWELQKKKEAWEYINKHIDYFWS